MAEPQQNDVVVNDLNEQEDDDAEDDEMSLSVQQDEHDNDAMSDADNGSLSSFDSQDDDDDADDSEASSYNMMDPDDFLLQESTSPRQKLEAFLERISTSASKVFKITDHCVLDYNLIGGVQQQQFVGGGGEGVGGEEYDNDNHDDHDDEAPMMQPAAAALLTRDLLEAVQANSGLTHCILGHQILQLLGPKGQLTILNAVACHDTCLFWKLGTDHSMQTGTLHTPAILQALSSHATPALAEMELRGLTLSTNQQVQELATIISARTTILRQLNLLGVHVPTTSAASPTAAAGGRTRDGFLDPLLIALATVVPLDEFKLIGLGQPRANSLVTVSALSTMLETKKKWWRLVLDCLGLDDGHSHVIVAKFSRDDTCKAGDLFSLQDNPDISTASLKQLASLFFRKRRMGAVTLDHGGCWDSQFDLVRSMNNLHTRLDFLDQGAYTNRRTWVSWLDKLNKAQWEDDQHKLNYLWFTLLEKPDFIFRRVER